MNSEEIENYIKEIKLTNYISPELIIKILLHLKHQSTEICRDWCCDGE